MSELFGNRRRVVEGLVADTVPLKQIVSAVVAHLYDDLAKTKKELHHVGEGLRQRVLQAWVRSARYTLMQLYTLIRWVPQLRKLDGPLSAFRRQNSQLQGFINAMGRMQRPLFAATAKPIDVRGGLRLALKGRGAELQSSLVQELTQGELSQLYTGHETAGDLHRRVWIALQQEPYFAFSHIFITRTGVRVRAEHEFEVTLDLKQHRWRVMDVTLLAGTDRKAAKIAENRSRAYGIPEFLALQAGADGSVRAVSKEELVSVASFALDRAYKSQSQLKTATLMETSLTPLATLYRELHEFVIRVVIDSYLLQAIWLQNVAAIADAYEARIAVESASKEEQQRAEGARVSELHSAVGKDAASAVEEANTWGWWNLPGSDLAGRVQAVCEEMPFRVQNDVVEPDDQKKAKPNRNYTVRTVPRLIISYWLTTYGDRRAPTPSLVRRVRQNVETQNKSTSTWWNEHEQELYSRGRAGFIIEPDAGHGWESSTKDTSMHGGPFLQRMFRELGLQKDEHSVSYGWDDLFADEDSQNSENGTVTLLKTKKPPSKHILLPIVLRLVPSPAQLPPLRLKLTTLHLRSLVTKCMSIHSRLYTRAIYSSLRGLPSPHFHSVEYSSGALIHADNVSHGAPCVYIWLNERLGLQCASIPVSGEVRLEFVLRKGASRVEPLLVNQYMRGLRSSAVAAMMENISGTLQRELSSTTYASHVRSLMEMAVNLITNTCRETEALLPPSETPAPAVPKVAEPTPPSEKTVKDDLDIGDLAVPELSIDSFDQEEEDIEAPSLDLYESNWMLKQRERQKVMVATSIELLQAAAKEVLEGKAHEDAAEHANKRQKVAEVQPGAAPPTFFAVVKPQVTATAKSQVARHYQPLVKGSQPHSRPHPTRSEPRIALATVQGSASSLTRQGTEELWPAIAVPGAVVRRNVAGGGDSTSSLARMVVVEAAVAPSEGAAAAAPGPNQAALDEATKLLGNISFSLASSDFESQMWYTLSSMAALQHGSVVGQCLVANMDALYQAITLGVSKVPLFQPVPCHGVACHVKATMKDWEQLPDATNVADMLLVSMKDAGEAAITRPACLQWEQIEKSLGLGSASQPWTLERIVNSMQPHGRLEPEAPATAESLAPVQPYSHSYNLLTKFGSLWAWLLRSVASNSTQASLAMPGQNAILFTQEVPAASLKVGLEEMQFTVPLKPLLVPPGGFNTAMYRSQDLRQSRLQPQPQKPQQGLLGWPAMEKTYDFHAWEGMPGEAVVALLCSTSLQLYSFPAMQPLPSLPSTARVVFVVASEGLTNAAEVLPAQMSPLAANGVHFVIILSTAPAESIPTPSPGLASGQEQLSLPSLTFTAFQHASIVEAFNKDGLRWCLHGLNASAFRRLWAACLTVAQSAVPPNETPQHFLADVAVAASRLHEPVGVIPVPEIPDILSDTAPQVVQDEDSTDSSETKDVDMTTGLPPPTPLPFPLSHDIDKEAHTIAMFRNTVAFSQRITAIKFLAEELASQHHVGLKLHTDDASLEVSIATGSNAEPLVWSLSLDLLRSAPLSLYAPPLCFIAECRMGGRLQWKGFIGNDGVISEAGASPSDLITVAQCLWGQQGNSARVAGEGSQTKDLHIPGPTTVFRAAAYPGTTERNLENVLAALAELSAVALGHSALVETLKKAGSGGGALSLTDRGMIAADVTQARRLTLKYHDDSIDVDIHPAALLLGSRLPAPWTRWHRPTAFVEAIVQASRSVDWRLRPADECGHSPLRHLLTAFEVEILGFQTRGGEFPVDRWERLCAVWLPVAKALHPSVTQWSFDDTSAVTLETSEFTALLRLQDAGDISVRVRYRGQNEWKSALVPPQEVAGLLK